MIQFIKNKGMFLLLLLAALVVLAAMIAFTTPVAVAGPDTVNAYQVPWNVVASGGTVMSSASYTLMGTAGQPVAGPSNSSSNTLIAGYWQALEGFLREIFLPAVMAD